ncbi:MAG: diguanylate cyclase [Nocardioidaceae bacterium]
MRGGRPGALIDAEDRVLPPRPRWGVGRPAPILLGLGLVGVAAALAPPYHLHVRSLVAGLVLLPVVIGLYADVLRRDRRTWVDPLAPWATFALVALLRHGAGGAESQLAVLVAIPVCWLALYGTRGDLVVGAVLATTTLVAPLVLLGAPDYPVAGWRPAVLWIGVTALLVPLVQNGLQRRGREDAAVADRHRELVTTLDGVLHGATMVGLVTVDPAGRILSLGKGAEMLYGRAAAGLVGQELVSVLCDRRELAETAAQLRVDPGFEVFAKLARLRAPARVWACTGSDGEAIAVRIGVSELRDERGELLGYLCVCSDETEMQRARRDLAEAEERWRVLLEHLPDTTVVLVEQGRGIKVVTGAGRIASRMRDSAGRWLRELAEEQRVPLDLMLEEAFAGSEMVLPHDARAGLSDTEITVSPLPSESARALALVMVRDVSRDRRRQRAITAAKERAERLFAHAPQGIAVLRPDGVILQANPALGRLLGRSDLEGVALSSLSYDEADTTVLRHLESLLAGAGDVSSGQWAVRRPDGRETHVVLSSTVLPGRDREPDQVLTYVVDVSERYRYEQQLAHLANHDPLTGLSNRRHFDDELARHVESCRRYGVTGALLVLDLDHFKEVNDALGHAAGDELLVQVAEILRARLRSTDVVARLGGDEFAVLLPHADAKAAALVAQSIVERVRGALAGLPDRRHEVTVSVGGVLVESPEVTGSDLLSSADSAMYAAKSAGRNQYVLLG